MTQITHLRGIPALRPLRGRHPAVVVCLDDPRRSSRAATSSRASTRSSSSSASRRAVGAPRPPLGHGRRPLPRGRAARRRARARRGRQERALAGDPLRGVPAVERRHGPVRGRLGLSAATLIALETPHGPARVHLHAAADPRAALVLGHGAGGGIAATSSTVTRVAPGATSAWRSSSSPTASRGGARRRARRCSTRPGSRSWSSSRDGPLAGLPLITGGRSSGARVACRTAAATGAIGVLCLAFPLVAPSGEPAARTSSTSVAVSGARRAGRERPLRDPRSRPSARSVVDRARRPRAEVRPAAVADAAATWLLVQLARVG